MLGNLFNDLFNELGDSSNRRYNYTNNTDLIYTKLSSIEAKSKAKEASTEVAQLKLKMEKLMIITEALWVVLKENTNYTDETLKEIIREIDLKDGKLDGRVAAELPGECPNCGKTLQKNKNVCIYCGTKVEDPDVFSR